MSDNPFRVKQIDHVELFVPDQYEAAAWYQKTFGLEVLPDYEYWAENGPLMISSDEGNTMLALFKGEPRDCKSRGAFKRVAFRVEGEGFVNFSKRLADYPVYAPDGRLVHTLEVIDHDLAYSVYFCDPYGNHFEVTTYDIQYVQSRMFNAD